MATKSSTIVNGVKVSGTINGEKAVATPVVGAADNRSALQRLNMSVGNFSRDDYPAPKTSGIKIRGTGCATKGKMARGPMG